jgi:surfeit locus 1 family protein
MITKLFTKGWILTTLLVVIAAGVMVRLGIWQLDRLEQRRALNARVSEQLDAPPLDLNSAIMEYGENISELGLEGMEYREITVKGEYDFSQEVFLRNQAYDGQIGVHLLTPLIISGSDKVVLVDRGWIPQGDAKATALEKYQEPGEVRIDGMIRASRTRPELGRQTDPAFVSEEPLDSFFVANIDRIEQEMTYSLLPVYILQNPNLGESGLPARTDLNITLTEGSHLGYALQWFAFAAILVGGYPFFVKSRVDKKEGIQVTTGETWKN